MFIQGHSALNKPVKLSLAIGARLEGATKAQSRWHAQLAGYQVMPIEELFSWQPVVLNLSLKAIISRAGLRVNCACCGEEILNEREIMVDGQAFCRTCHDGGYYQALEFEPQAFAHHTSP